MSSAGDHIRRPTARWRGILVNVALLIGVLLGCALAVEGAARWMEWRRVRQALRVGHETPPAFLFNPVLGWEMAPKVERRVARGEFDVVMRTNSRGLRGPERSEERPAGVRRVLVLGDSFAAGYYVKDDDMFSAVLERRLAADGCSPVEVISGGVPGYSTDQEYLFYLEKGARYDPQVVVLMFYYNDLYNNTRPRNGMGEPKPLFEVEDGRPVLKNVPLAPLAGTGAAGGEGAATKVERLPPWRGSLALRLLARRTERGNPRLHRALAAMGLVPPLVSRPHEELFVFGPSPDVPPMWRLETALLAALKKETEARGAQLIVLYVPVRFEVNDQVWKLTRERYELGRKWRPEKVAERLRAACDALGIRLVDPRSGLRRAESSSQPAYFTYDVHWTARGNAIAAENAAPAVRRALACPGR